MKSWKTSTTGIVAVLAALANAASLLLDDNPATVPDWTATIAAISAGLGLIFARDNKVTSEQAGATSAKISHPGTSPGAGVILLGLIIPALALSTGCRALAPDGAYSGDQVLYHAELTITTSYDVLHTFVAWEKENRAALVQWPDVKKSADTIRRGAPHWFKTAHALRDAYLAAPTPDNRAALERILKVLRTALGEAAFYMSQAAQPAPTPPVSGIGVNTEP
jgi:hypothetical protein